MTIYKESSSYKDQVSGEVLGLYVIFEILLYSEAGYRNEKGHILKLAVDRSIGSMVLPSTPTQEMQCVYDIDLDPVLEGHLYLSDNCLHNFIDTTNM